MEIPLRAACSKPVSFNASANKIIALSPQFSYAVANNFSIAPLGMTRLTKSNGILSDFGNNSPKIMRPAVVAYVLPLIRA